MEFERWGEQPEGWGGGGAPGIGMFGTALQVWAMMQPGEVSVAQAAEAFHVSPKRICEAVEFHCWMELAGPTDDFTKLTIVHDGE